MHTASFSPATQTLKINTVTFETKKALLIRPKSDCVPNTLHMLLLDFLQHTKARTPAYMPRNRHHSSLRLCCLAEIVFKEVCNTPSFPKSREIKQKEWGGKKKQTNKGKERKNSTLKAKKKNTYSKAAMAVRRAWSAARRIGDSRHRNGSRPEVVHPKKHDNRSTIYRRTDKPQKNPASF